MIIGKVKIDNELIKGVIIFESTETGIPLKRNNTYLTTTTNDKGEYKLNLPVSDTNFVTYKFAGTKGATISTKRVPLTLNLTNDNLLDEVDVITSKKFNYLWLLLLIPVIYLITKKK